MARLARLVVKDGEGATKIVEITVRGARTAADAERAAEAVARSPLCKAAFHGGDPYMGRVVCALGYSGAAFAPERLEIYLDGVCVVRGGRERIRGALERRAERIVQRPEFSLTIDLHAGPCSARRIASDLSPEYVRFNSAYRT
jgi:glutamate N-acetyltransferase/amino-acid N-acetyltransferase